MGKYTKVITSPSASVCSHYVYICMLDCSWFYLNCSRNRSLAAQLIALEILRFVHFSGGAAGEQKFVLLILLSYFSLPLLIVLRFSIAITSGSCSSVFVRSQSPSLFPRRYLRHCSRYCHAYTYRNRTITWIFLLSDLDVKSALPSSFLS